MIINYGRNLEFQNQTASAKLNLEWFVSYTHSITNINTTNHAPATQKK